jgi:hypothetical protein
MGVKIMRWKKIKPTSVNIGDISTSKKFAWLPVDVGDEVIWLESYVIMYKYTEFYGTKWARNNPDLPTPYRKWVEYKRESSGSLVDQVGK